jgi:hypothetical protein
MFRTSQPQSFDFGDRAYKAWNIGKPSEFDCPATFARGRRLTSLNITEKIGGNDYSDHVRVEIKANAAIQLITQGAIAEIVNSKHQVVASSNDSYESKVETTLKPGTYFLHFSSESSMEEIFTSKFAVRYV